MAPAALAIVPSELRLHGSLIPAQSLLGWSASAALPPLPASEDRYLVHFEGVPANGVDFQVVLRGSQPVEIELRGIEGAAVGDAAIDSVRKQSPPWATLHAISYRVSRLGI
jgi:hypothetical protein